VVVNLFDDEALAERLPAERAPAEPWMFVAASLSWRLKPSKPPKNSLMAAPSSPSGCPPPRGLMFFHSRECSTCPDK
jgi:hypothetical protein